jgi:multisubunit Na+/H+ antiporter MnhG subunit
MYQKFFKYLEFLAPPAPIVVGTWSIVLLIGCAYSIYYTKQISAPISVIFSAVLTNFTAHKIAKVMNGQAVSDQTTDLDIQGQGDSNGKDQSASK